jgi:hypothetical protein
MKHNVFDKYLTDIKKIFRLSDEDFFKPTKNKTVLEAKQLLYYMCSRRQIRVAAIKEMMDKAGAKYGYIVHGSNVLRGITKAQNMVDSDEDYFKIMKRIEDSTFV